MGHHQARPGAAALAGTYTTFNSRRSLQATGALFSLGLCPLGSECLGSPTKRACALHTDPRAVYQRLFLGAQPCCVQPLNHSLFLQTNQPTLCSSPPATRWCSTCCTRAAWRRRAPSSTAPSRATWAAWGRRWVCCEAWMGLLAVTQPWQMKGEGCHGYIEPSLYYCLRQASWTRSCRRPPPPPPPPPPPTHPHTTPPTHPHPTPPTPPLQRRLKEIEQLEAKAAGILDEVARRAGLSEQAEDLWARCASMCPFTNPSILTRSPALC